jgi:hypothetical protein
MQGAVRMMIAVALQNIVYLEIQHNRQKYTGIIKITEIIKK